MVVLKTWLPCYDSGNRTGSLLQVEPAVKRAPLNDRKKRKLGDVDNSGAVAAKAKDSGSEAVSEASSAPTALHSKPAAAAGPPKVSARASKKARQQKGGTKPASNPKQRLVRTVALGNLQSGTKEEALAMAQAAGKVHMQLTHPDRPQYTGDAMQGNIYRLTCALLLLHRLRVLRIHLLT